MRMTSKTRKWLKRLGVVILLAAVLAGTGAVYLRWKSGRVAVDASLLTEQSMARIAGNWPRLVESGRFTLLSEENGVVYLMHAVDENAPAQDRDLFRLTVAEKPFTYLGYTDFPPMVMSATYSRVGIADALSGNGRLGECTVAISVSSPHCLIDMYDFHSDGSDRVFREFMAETLAALGE